MFKKIAIAAVIAASASLANAADYVSIDVDHVKSLQGYGESQAQYVRAGKEIAGIQYGLQSRTSVADSGGMYNSLELTAGKNFKAFTPFVGVGHDNGANGAKGQAYTYGLVGATAGTQVGPGFALVGAKTRMFSDETKRTKQTVLFGTYSYPVTKTVAVNLNLSKSYQSIKEDAYGLGLSFNF